MGIHEMQILQFAENNPLKKLFEILGSQIYSLFLSYQWKHSERTLIVNTY